MACDSIEFWLALIALAMLLKGGSSSGRRTYINDGPPKYARPPVHGQGERR
jgi:hypothetical protein